MINSLHVKAAAGDSGGSPPFGPSRVGSDAERLRPIDYIVDGVAHHWLIAVLIFLAGMTCGGFVLWKKDKPVYEAHSVVYVSPKFPKILANDNEVDLPYDSYFADQVQRSTRYDIIEAAIAKLPYTVRHWTGPVLPYEIQLLQQRLEVKRIGFTYEMSISLTGPSPRGLAETVNAVTDTYVEKAKNEEFYGLDSRLATLHQEQDRLQKQMGDRLEEQAHLMQQLGVATISSGEGATNPYDATSQTIRGQLAAARMDREAAEARYEAVLKGEGSEGSAALDTTGDDAISADASLSVTRTNLNNRRAQLMQEMSGMRPDHPIYQKDKEEMASIDGQLNDLRRSASQHVQEKLRQDVTRTRMVELQLIRELGEKTLAATTAAPKFQRAAELGPEIDSLQKAYDAVDDRIRELELESSSPGSIHVSTKALTPLGAQPSKLRFFLLALSFLSSVCAVAAAAGMDLLDSRVYTPQDVERVVGFHPLGILLNDDEFRTEVSGEYYFRLAAGVEYAFRTSGVRTFLFTSPAHGSGTTTVVKKLNEELRGLKLSTRTITASASDQRDVSRSGGPLQPGHLLESRSKTDEIQSSPPTPLATIFDVCENARRPNETTPSPVVQTLHQARELCDVVLIDANPLPISATTEYLARLADATIVVVRSGMTTKHELHRAARLLERLEVAGIAVVLNNVSQNRADRAMKREFRGYEQSIGKRNPTARAATAEEERSL
jgi:polysaccharide biosynthesis transport protein